MMASIDEITQKYVFGVRWTPPHLSQHVEQIEQLTMQITHDGDGRRNRLHIGLLHEQFGNNGTQLLQTSFRYAFSWL